MYVRKRFEIIFLISLLCCLQSFHCYRNLWRWHTLSSRPWILLSSNKPTELNSNPPKTSSYFDRSRQRLQEEAAKLRQEADTAAAIQQSTNTSQIFVAEDLKGFIVDPPVLTVLKELKENLTSGGVENERNGVRLSTGNRPTILDIDFSTIPISELPSWEPLLNYLKVIRKYDVTKFNENGIAIDDVGLVDDLGVDTYNDELMKKTFLLTLSDIIQDNEKYKEKKREQMEDLLAISAFNVLSYLAKAKGVSLKNPIEMVKSMFSLEFESEYESEDILHEATEEFFSALVAYVEWRENPAIKPLLKKTEFIYRSASGVSATLAYPKVPFGLRPIITDPSIIKEIYWKHLTRNNMTNTYPITAYITLLSTALATKASTKSSPTATSLLPIIDETIATLQQYFRFLYQYKINKLDKNGLPDFSSLFEGFSWEQVHKSKILKSIEKDIPEDVDYPLYLKAALIRESYTGLISDDTEEEKNARLLRIYNNLKEFSQWRAKFDPLQTATIDSDENPLFILYQRYYKAYELLVEKQQTRLRNPVAWLILPDKAESVLYQFLTAPVDDNGEVFRVDEKSLSVILRYWSVLEEYMMLSTKIDPKDGIVMLDNLKPKDSRIAKILDDYIRKKWESFKQSLSFSSPTDEETDFALYSSALLSYYRFLFKRKLDNFKEKISTPEVTDGLGIEQEFLSLPSSDSLELTLSPEELVEFSKSEDYLETLSKFIEKRKAPLISDPEIDTEYEEKLQSYLQYAAILTTEDEDIKRIFNAFREYRFWRFSPTGQELWEKAEKIARQSSKRPTVTGKPYEAFEELQYLYQLDLLTIYPVNEIYAILINAYQIFGKGVKFSHIINLLSYSLPLPAVIASKEAAIQKGKETIDLKALLEEKKRSNDAGENPLLTTISSKSQSKKVPELNSNESLLYNLFESMFNSSSSSGASSKTQKFIQEFLSDFQYEADRFIVNTFDVPNQQISLEKAVLAIKDDLLIASNSTIVTGDALVDDGEVEEEEDPFISKELAEEVRGTILKDVSLHSMRSFKGAYILQSEVMERDAQSFCNKVEKRFNQYRNYSQLLDYVIIYDEYIPSDFSDESMTQAALDRPRPTLILYPKTWKSAVGVKVESSRLLDLVFTGTYLLSTVTYAVRSFSYGYSPEELTTQFTNFLPTDLFPMIFTSLFIQLFSCKIEEFIAAMKGVSLKSYFLPSFGDIPTFGVHNALLQLPKNRKEVFDIFISGIIPTLLLSFGCIITGLNSIPDIPADQISHLPAIPLSFLKANYFLEQFLTTNYPQLFTEVDLTKGSTLLHLPWLTVVGIASFIGNIFRLLPFDKASIGRKLSYAVFGNRSDGFISTIAGITKVILLLSIGIFSDMSVNSLPKELLFQYLVIASVLPENAGPLISKNDISDVGEFRRIVFFFLMFFGFICFFPSSWSVGTVQSNLQTLFPNVF